MPRVRFTSYAPTGGKVGDVRDVTAREAAALVRDGLGEVVEAKRPAVVDVDAQPVKTKIRKKKSAAGNAAEDGDQDATAVSGQEGE